MIIKQVSINSIEKIANNSVITIGMFDGFHKYHKLIINEVIQIGNTNNLNKILLTFTNKPASNKETILKQENKIQYIKENFDIDYLYIIETNKDLITTSKETFINILKEKLNVKKIVEGSDFRFGFNHEGNVSALQSEFGNDNVIIYERDNSYSSSRLRDLIHDNQKEKVYLELEVDQKLLK